MRYAQASRLHRHPGDFLFYRGFFKRGGFQERWLVRRTFQEENR